MDTNPEIIVCSVCSQLSRFALVLCLRMFIFPALTISYTVGAQLILGF